MIDWWSEEAKYINPFDLHHFIYISVLAIALTALILNRRKVKANAKKIGTIILSISVFQQILLYSWYFLEMGFDVSESLPLHICRISSLLGIYFLITKNTKVLDVMFYFGLYAYGSFLYPQRVYPVYHVIGISFVINHAVTLLLPYFGYIAYNWRSDFKGLIKSYCIFLAYFGFVYILNPLIDGNYFYLKYRPFFKVWPDMVYVPFILIFTFCAFLLGYVAVKSIAGREKKDNEDNHTELEKADA